MTYVYMNIPFVVISLAVSYFCDKRVFRRRNTWILLLLLMIMTTIFDYYLTRMPIVGYNEAAISGVKIGTIPIEDYAYTIVLAFLPASVWRKYGNK